MSASTASIPSFVVTGQGPSRLGRAITVRKLRLASGIVLFTYVSLHLMDHALGNVSIAAMETMLIGMKALWQSVPGTVVLYTAMVTHLLLAFWALYERRYFRWRVSEMVQLVLGFAIPALLANHILNTRVSQTLLHTDKRYMIELYSFWVGNIPFGIVQHVVLVVAWTHGCLGIYFWLRIKRWFPRVYGLLLAGAVLLPVLALMGSFQGGRQIQALAQDPAWRATYLTPGHVGVAADNAMLAGWRMNAWIVFGLAIAAVLLARGVRHLIENRRERLHLSYPDQRTIRAPLGLSVLEASRLNNIPHTSVCGGRGRCTTCRIHVIDHAGLLPTPSAEEAAALRRVNAGAGVRLACQLRPLADLRLTPLLPAGGASSSRRQPIRDGEERYLVMMFVDLRGSTKLAENRLPFDTVFVINSFLSAIGTAVSDAGGQANQMLGDGMLALFGLQDNPDVAARQAIAACAGIARNVRTLNEQLGTQIPEPLRYGIGLRGGEVIVGDVGYRDHMVFTALGDAVNVAARLEGLTKDYQCELLVAEDVYQAANGPAHWAKHTVTARGRAEVIEVRGATEQDLLTMMEDRATT